MKIRTLGYKSLICKCSEVPIRGHDNNIRNGHYHCLLCQKPCDQPKALGVHMVSRHKVNTAVMDHL